MGLFGKRYIRFTENEYTFYQKQIYILPKMDIHFTENGYTFYLKRRYILPKTEVRFA